MPATSGGVGGPRGVAWARWNARKQGHGGGGSRTLGPRLWGWGQGPQQRLLRCGGRGTALTRRHRGQSSVSEPAVWAQRRAGNRRCSWAPPSGEQASKPWRQPRLRDPRPPPKETAVSGPSGEPGCPPYLLAVDTAAPGLWWARPHCQNPPVSDPPPTHTKTGWFPGCCVARTAGSAAHTASPWPAAGAQTG